jgi:hypothetical protein
MFATQEGVFPRDVRGPRGALLILVIMSDYYTVRRRVQEGRSRRMYDNIISRRLEEPSGYGWCGVQYTLLGTYAS